MVPPVEAFNRMKQSSRDFIIAVASSVFIHLLVAVIAFVFTSYSPAVSKMPQSIDVDLTMMQAPPAEKEKKTPPSKKTVVKKKKKKKVSKKPAKKKIPLKKKKKPPINKKKVANKKDIIKDAPERQKKEEPADPLAERLARLKEEVRQEEKTVDRGKAGGVNPITGRENLMIAQYEAYIKVAVSENWSFSKSLAGGNSSLRTVIRIAVMPDGEVRGLNIVKESGNDYLDSAAAMAIRRASPLAPFPQGINRKRLEFNLNFEPTE